ncbi:MAG: ABC transporter permease [bacterium]
MIRPGIRRLLAFATRTRRGREREVNEEIRVHFELRTEQLMRGGLSREDALRLAEQRFGPLEESRDQLLNAAAAREKRMTVNDHIESIQQDVAFALRQLRRSPAFAVTVIVTLGLGIGANATMFGVVDRLLLQPPVGVVDPARVVTPSVQAGHRMQHVQDRLSYPIYRDLRNTTDVFSEVGAWDTNALTVGDGQNAVSIAGIIATASYFRALGVRPLLGRFFTDEETDIAPAPRVIVLGYWYWQRQLAGAATAVGSTIVISGQPFTVIGIAPRDFNGLGLGDVAAWAPFTTSTSAADFAEWSHTRQRFMLNIVARLRPGVSLQAATTQGTAGLHAGSRLDSYTDADIRDRNEQLMLTSALPRDARGGRAEARVATLVAAVSLLVLIIACANVANLQVARAMSRRREVAIRLALGISRRRLLRQLALDGLILSVAGGAAALVIVAWGGGFVRRLLLNGASAQVSPVNWRVMVFTAVIAVLTGVVTGLLPAVQSTRADLSRALRTGGRGAHGSFSRTRFALIGVQAALTIVLLVGTVLFVRSLWRIEAVPLGMETGRILEARVNSSGRDYSNEQRVRDYERLERAAVAIPEVDGAAMSMTKPFGSSSGVEVVIPGRDSVQTTRTGGPYYNAVSPDFFRTMGTRVVGGRAFTIGDRAGAAPVAIVNQTTATLWWPNENAIGKCIKIGGDSMPCSEIVGVVENTRRQAIIEDPTVMVFTPLGQGPSWATPYTLFIRTRQAAPDVATSVAAQLRAAAPGVPYTSVRPFDDSINPQMRSWRLGATMFGLFAGVALLLAAVGLYGVMAYDVTQRTTEIGVRMALGARAVDIGRLVVWRGVRIAAVGGVIGVVLAIAAGSRVSSLLFQTSAYEPVAFLLAASVLCGVTLFATLVPALRATRVDPNTSLRAD